MAAPVHRGLAAIPGLPQDLQVSPATRGCYNSGGTSELTHRETYRKELINLQPCALQPISAGRDYTQTYLPSEQRAFERTQAGAFIPKLLEQTRLLKEAETDEAILELNVILVYKKLVQGLIYSPPDCDKHLALDAKLQVSVALAPTVSRGDRLATISQGLAAPEGACMCKKIREQPLCAHVSSRLVVRPVSFIKHRPTRRTSSAC